MIKNEKQYRITKAQMTGGFQDAVAEVAGQARPFVERQRHDYAEAQRAAAQSQVEELARAG